MVRCNQRRSIDHVEEMLAAIFTRQSYADDLRIINYLQLAFANPGTIVAQKLKGAGLVDKIGLEWFFLTVGEAVESCTVRLRVNAL
jgi:hypothetical protein